MIYMIQVITCKPDELNIDRHEVLRYLGYGRDADCSDILDAVEKCIAEIQPKTTPRAVYDVFDIHEGSGGVLSLGFTETGSESLKRNLKDCEKIILFTATVGIETDRIIQRYSHVSPSNALIAQAVGATVIEAWCDFLCEYFAAEAESMGYHLRPRFSPGYGDFPLEVQKRIFSVLDCNRKIGVSLTDSLLMVPGKSVSAIVGLSRENLHCVSSGCEACENINCEYRRGK